MGDGVDLCVSEANLVQASLGDRKTLSSRNKKEEEEEEEEEEREKEGKNKKTPDVH